MERSPDRGFTYLMLLWWIAVSGIMLAALGQSWSIEMRRQREIELVFRGEQIRAALLAYQANTPGEVKLLPNRLDDLLVDERGPVVKHHLRRLWPDPITGKPWGLIRDGDFIIGVYSTSLHEPLRAPSGIAGYGQWQFVVRSISVLIPANDSSSVVGSSMPVDFN